MIETFGTYMKKNGWSIEWNEDRGACLPKNVTDRYQNIPGLWLELIHKIKCLTSPDDTVWFLCAKDFATQSEEAFQWNEWERLSLESSGNDAEWEKEIRGFWDAHLPVVMSVRDGYSYYAIAIKDGSVVYGSEPEFEECETIADSFKDFLSKIIKGEWQI